MIFYERYNKICRQKGTSPSKVATEAGLNKATVTYWKSGTVPKADAVVNIAKLLNTSTDYLLGLTDTEIQENNLTPTEQELLLLFNTVPEEKKEQVLDLFRTQISLIK